MAKLQLNKKIPAIKVNQWMEEWNKVNFDENSHRRKPEPYFYMFSLPAPMLRALTGISRRDTGAGTKRSEDLGIQRRHDAARSKEIHEFIPYGYPWSELNQFKRQSTQFNNLRKPGWLPTAIVVNILTPLDLRNNQKVFDKDQITIDNSNNSLQVILPESFSGADWHPTNQHPIEVIDGQHRLWAFEGDNNIASDFELPVVAFYGLDISWQAYLFWTINIKPKRINSSLAFDLYPLLRTQDWLEKVEGHSVYRETRAQELTEALWSNPKSPWYHRINMLGETGLGPMVTQAAWVRSLITTYIKPYDTSEGGIGGLFGAAIKEKGEVLPWSRSQQAAFLIYMAQKVCEAIEGSKDPWAQALRNGQQKDMFEEKNYDQAFYGTRSLLSTDQGIRGLLYVTNDLFYIAEDELKLSAWVVDQNGGATDDEAVQQGLESISKQPFSNFIAEIAERLASYDWRTSAANGLTEEERTLKLALRGSGGYKQLRLELLRHLSKDSKKAVSKRAKNVLTLLKYKEG